MPRYKSGFFGNLTRLVNKTTRNKRKYRKKRYNRRKKQMRGGFWAFGDHY